ncbi:hypothetical protein HUC50_09075 [Escherichia coli]|uniref:Uncharacterized protein n=5 Tax=Enterobacteriaceae TaxID=543 RepID=B2TVH6_SHIB3|nr:MULTISPECIES: hypothetical protein [Enterobacteriaceae]ACD09406.1 hypothetical protein SbBS512_E4296 [Shigella boydii CDC 3083-94]AHG11537.1 hypothetical protein ECRM13514_4898 [Escherichia coli O145:H28 str. RM13514]AHG17284.1 hypothetical protein ECRM13516_4681 [Escherichia coli O145:H28 str. RM13516]AHY67607.1 hypothetical protein ECRM12761_22850 [Escherichia coli O145:H28 str. RM12761]AHY73359.1 hypothetical protein ECRM12581_24145 [Escherichia coli O145:H28 str. RM12581]EFW51796.1 hyp
MITEQIAQDYILRKNDSVISVSERAQIAKWLPVMEAIRLLAKCALFMPDAA